MGGTFAPSGLGELYEGLKYFVPSTQFSAVLT